MDSEISFRQKLEDYLTTYGEFGEFLPNVVHEIRSVNSETELYESSVFKHIVSNSPLEHLFD